MSYLAACDAFVGDTPGGGQRVAWELCKLVRANGRTIQLHAAAGLLLAAGILLHL